MLRLPLVPTVGILGLDCEGSSEDLLVVSITAVRNGTRNTQKGGMTHSMSSYIPVAKEVTSEG